MSNEPVLKIDGEVNASHALTFSDLEAIDALHQIIDVSQFDPKRQGDAVKLSGLLELVGAKDSAKYIGLHGTLDNFHASIPLTPVRDSAFVIYRVNGKPLDVKAGGPFRFYIPDHAACHTDEIDECANVKFVDHIELTSERGFDNRPDDDEEHAKLHKKEHLS
ncbi:MAG: molybdopterin-dependent oxidoreductase [Planctomycetaceae bacterium]|nr:molybdopterin-dependent oxidoreductase [Planctomycetales bacterium]MCB9873409.1 molybdopterin-dependent oxidoreductase [Planctomycetaceae bacterium]MCB9939084.1 molybdopterin-dependent oxidoreductase [Planctomycetaceae bacterium]HRX80964.1 molybdopterin-dependent oxidoreductase [Pirellulaceae bacterium]